MGLFPPRERFRRLRRLAGAHHYATHEGTNTISDLCRAGAPTHTKSDTTADRKPDSETDIKFGTDGEPISPWKVTEEEEKEGREDAKEERKEEGQTSQARKRRQ